MIDSKLVGPVLNLSNSIIGVVFLTMPFCFEQCGFLLGSLIVVGVAALTIATSEFLLRAGLHHNRIGFEAVALTCLGASGKFCVELAMFGLMFGTLTAYTVIIADLSSEAFSQAFGALPPPPPTPAVLSVSATPASAVTTVSKVSWTTRCALVILIQCCVITPLCLRRNLKSLTKVSAVSMGIYAVILIQLISMAVPLFFGQENAGMISAWRTIGLVKIVPILAIAFSTQTQIFNVFHLMQQSNCCQDSDVIKVLRVSVCLVSVIYVTVGFFGYLVFVSHKPRLLGDLLAMYPATPEYFVLKLSFMYTVAVSCPLAMFPLRTALHSLIFESQFRLDGGLFSSLFSASSTSALTSVNSAATAACSTSANKELPMLSPNEIPHTRFRNITLVILTLSTAAGLLTANVDSVLAVTGSVCGSIILYVLPSLIFLRTFPSNPLRPIASVAIFFGALLIFSATLTGISDKTNHPSTSLPAFPINPLIPKTQNHIVRQSPSISFSSNSSSSSPHSAQTPRVLMSSKSSLHSALSRFDGKSSIIKLKTSKNSSSNLSSLLLSSSSSFSSRSFTLTPMSRRFKSSRIAASSSRSVTFKPPQKRFIRDSLSVSNTAEKNIKSTFTGNAASNQKRPAASTTPFVLLPANGSAQKNSTLFHSP